MTNDPTAVPTTFDASVFRKVLGHFPTGVTVVTTVEEGAPVGLAVGSFFSVSLEPPLVGFCVANTSSTWPHIAATGHFCVNVLADDQSELSGRFATKGGDKFEGVDWQPAWVTGAPMLPGCLAHIDCTLGDTFEAGDHTIAIGEVKMLDVVRADSGPLLFVKGAYGRHLALEL